MFTILPPKFKSSLLKRKVRELSGVLESQANVTGYLYSGHLSEEYGGRCYFSANPFHLSWKSQCWVVNDHALERFASVLPQSMLCLTVWWEMPLLYCTPSCTMLLSKFGQIVWASDEPGKAEGHLLDSVVIYFFRHKIITAFFFFEMNELSLCLEKNEDGPRPSTSSGPPLLIGVDSAILFQALQTVRHCYIIISVL